MWASIIPGRTVAPERSVTVAPAGTEAADHGPTLSIRLPRTTMAWSRRTDAEVPSMSVPARMTVTGAGGGAWPRLPAAMKDVRRHTYPDFIRQNLLITEFR